MDRQLVILVEDDAVISELLVFNLQGDGYEIRAFRDGATLFSTLDQLPDPDLFILDIMLPGTSGLDICARIRTSARFDLTPILMLTALGSESDKVRGLETGADDYLTKPFGMRELLARVRALTRRRRRQMTRGCSESPDGPVDPEQTGTAAGELVIHPGQTACGNLLLDDMRHRVFRDGQEVEMTNREYELLKFLMIHRGVAFSRDELLDRVWGYDYGGETRTVDVHIRQLRRKLEANDAEPALIETVRGRGYRFADSH